MAARYQNYGFEVLGAPRRTTARKHRPHDDRYEVANEFADVVTRLWEAWHEDAVVLDPVTLMFVDGKRFRPINHEGKHFNVRGPTNAPRSRQGRVPIVQSQRRARFSRRSGPTPSSRKASTSRR